METKFTWCSLLAPTHITFPDENINTVRIPLSMGTFIKTAGNFCKLYFKLYFGLNLQNNSCKFCLLSHVAKT